MRTAFGVIGAGYGDEGKGRNVDAIAHALGGPGVTVVRSNGGAQAGHTVVTPGGTRHVFHHLGSGALAGASTHLSRHFVHHPMTFMEERRALASRGACVEVTADPRGYVTTPWDMMVNQVVEAARGGSRHGSCGYGLGETVGRNEETRFGLAFADLARADLAVRLAAIRDEWLPARLAALGVEPDPETRAAIASPGVMERFVWDCAMFRSNVGTMGDASLGSSRDVVFEAAQGLLLDQRGRDFPHVTRSNTGIENMCSIAREAGIARIEATYATRCYLTRHGAGPMPDERDLSPWLRIVDATNVPNPWQSSIRFGVLDPAALGAEIGRDLAKAAGVDVSASIAVSCLDQSLGTVPLMFGGSVVEVPVGEVVDRIAAGTDLPARGWWSPGRAPEAAAA